MADNGLGTPPHPKSPPEYPDVCGKHRLKVAIQTLNEEIDYLERELNSMEGTVPASRCCKELNEYICRNPDPLMKVYENKNKQCSVWKMLRAMLCCNWSRICCTRGCLSCSKRTMRSCCRQLKNIICCSWCCIGCPSCNCCKIGSCNVHPLSPCLECSCGCVCSCPRCARTCVCPGCTSCCRGRCIF